VPLAQFGETAAPEATARDQGTLDGGRYTLCLEGSLQHIRRLAVMYCLQHKA